MAESRTTITAPGRLIFGLMTFTIIFAVVADIIGENAKGQPSKPDEVFLIVGGGTVATSLLVLLSHAGEAGEQFATGLALITFLTVALVKGKPVWDAANTAFGSTPTTPVAQTTATTGTTGLATPAALSQIAA